MKQHLLIFLLFLAGGMQAAPRCQNTPGRSWWDVLHYDLHVSFNLAEQSLSGYNIITSKVKTGGQSVMELDLQLPMVIDSVVVGSLQLQTSERLIPFMQEDDICYIMFPFSGFRQDDSFSIKVFYHGKPKQAVNPPWDGGLVSKKDPAGNYWLAMACEGIGSSVWWPCKDMRSDEPDHGVDLYYECPKGYAAIGNGRLVNKLEKQESTLSHW